MKVDCRLRCEGHRPFLVVPENQGTLTSVLVQCPECELVFESPRPGRDAIEAFYSNEALWTNSVDAEGRPRSYVRELEAKKPLFDDLVRRIERYKRGGRLLDVGSGAGQLEQSLDASRWQVEGIESAKYIAEFGRQHLGTHVRHSTFDAADFTPASFDVIVMKYVLDHMEEPFEALRKARRLLKDDGLLVIADLINIESFCARMFGDGHRLIHPMHFTYFSPKTIRAHLKRAGFKIVQIEFPFFRTPYFTLKNLTMLGRRVCRRGINRLLGRRERVFSVAFYGNMMDVWATPEVNQA